MKLERARRQSSSRKTYKPYGAAKRLQRGNDREVILTGPTRTGKSLACLWKLYDLASSHPGLRALVIRKERTTLSETGMVTLERDVIGFDDPMIVNGPRRQFRAAYNLPNGSIIVVGGLDRPGKILSSEYDIIYVQQAEEIFESDWEVLITRLSGRVLPQEQQQIVGDCNPSYPGHWIKQRSLGGALKLWETYHRDNPLLWDHRLNDWTPYGRIYIDSLNTSLTGARRARLLEGKWEQAEGLVYEDFNEASVTDEEPDMTRREDGRLVYPIEVGYDDGYIDPRAILFIQRKPTRILVFDELYHTRHLSGKCAREILEVMARLHEVVVPDDLARSTNEELARWLRGKGVNLPDIAVGSPEAKEFQGALRLADIPSRDKPHEVVTGIEVVRRLVLDGNDYRTLQVNARCKNFIREMTEGYTYPPGTKRGNTEKPQDGNDHTCDAFRYWAYLRAR